MPCCCSGTFENSVLRGGEFLKILSIVLQFYREVLPKHVSSKTRQYIGMWIFECRRELIHKK
jgi:hypothetical protein